MATAVLPTADLRSLVAHRARGCVSIFLPTHRGGAEVRQDPVRLKNLLREAAERLATLGFDAAGADELLAPAHDLLAEPGSWRSRSDGLALFLAPGFFQEHRVPLELEERVTVGEEFEIRPLLPLLFGDGRFYVLALSQNSNRLYEASRHSIREIATPGVPASLEEALRFDDPERPQLQLHSIGGGARTGGGRGAAVFHGQAFTDDDSHVDVRRYCRQVDRGLEPILGHERVPLVLAAVDYVQAIYREANSYPLLLEQGIDGNPELTAADELLREARELVEPYFRSELDRARERFGDLSATAETSTSLEEILPAAWHARVDTLFLDRDQRVPGSFRPESGELHRAATAAGEGDLLDLAARKTLAQGGAVYALAREEMPADAAAAAIFRYPIPGAGGPGPRAGSDLARGPGGGGQQGGRT